MELDDSLYLPNPAKLVEFVTANPGCSTADVERYFGQTNVFHHIIDADRLGKIVMVKHPTCWRFYPPED